MDKKVVKRPDGGTCYCYGWLEEGENYHIVIDGGDYSMGDDFLWLDYDASIHGKTWKSLIKNLYKIHGWKVEQIQPC